MSNVSASRSIGDADADWVLRYCRGRFACDTMPTVASGCLRVAPCVAANFDGSHVPDASDSRIPEKFRITTLSVRQLR